MSITLSENMIINDLLQVSSVCRTVDGHVSCVLGYVGICSVLQQQTDDSWISGYSCFIQDGRLVLRLGQDVCTCSTQV